jgi:hypothetical protein
MTTSPLMPSAMDLLIMFLERSTNHFAVNLSTRCDPLGAKGYVSTFNRPSQRQACRHCLTLLQIIPQSCQQPERQAFTALGTSWKD